MSSSQVCTSVFVVCCVFHVFDLAHVCLQGGYGAQQGGYGGQQGWQNEQQIGGSGIDNEHWDQQHQGQGLWGDQQQPGAGLTGQGIIFLTYDTHTSPSVRIVMSYLWLM